MAKSRAQRKAERRAKAARQQQQPRSRAETDVEAQKRTQVPESGEVAEAEAAIEAGALADDAGGEDLEPRAPAPSRADVGKSEEPRESRRERKRREREEARRKEERRAARERGGRGTEVAERRRGGVSGFIASCWAELRRVQWPDRETLIQASAVTIVFVVVAATYLGALDALFNFVIKLVL